MRDLIGSTLGHYCIAAKIGEAEGTKMSGAPTT